MHLQDEIKVDGMHSKKSDLAISNILFCLCARAANSWYLQKISILSILQSQQKIEICTIRPQSTHKTLVLCAYGVYTGCASEINNFLNLRFLNWLGRNMSSSWMQAWKFMNIIHYFENAGSFNHASLQMASVNMYFRGDIQFLGKVINALKS